MSDLPLSILDLAPVPVGVSSSEALARTVDLAKLGDELGYTRLWYAEHHGMAAIASSSPDILIASAAAHTSRIRVGSGGVMLPNHVPLRVAESFRTLAGLYPGRIDLGIGRAGGSDSKGPIELCKEKWLRTVHAKGERIRALKLAAVGDWSKVQGIFAGNDVATLGPAGHACGNGALRACCVDESSTVSNVIDVCSDLRL